MGEIRRGRGRKRGGEREGGRGGGREGGREGGRKMILTSTAGVTTIDTASNVSYSEEVAIGMKKAEWYEGEGSSGIRE